MTAFATDTARSSAIPRELELQLLLGNAIEALLRLQSDVEVVADDTSVEVLQELATLFSEGLEDLHGTPRTLAQSATNLGVVGATRRAVAGSDRTLAQELSSLAEALHDIAAGGGGPTVDEVVGTLVKMHHGLASSRSLPPDEVSGLRRLV